MAKLPKPGVFTYNLTSPQILTEDRTLAYTYDLLIKLGRAIVQSSSRPFIEQVLQTDGDRAEGNLPYSSFKDTMPSPLFLEIANELKLSKSLRGSAKSLFIAYADALSSYGMSDPRVVEPTVAEAAKLATVRERLHSRGFDTLGVHVVFRTHTDHVSTRDGILSLPATLLNGEDTRLADAIVSGVAQLRGGSTLRQLCRYVASGEWMTPEEVSDSRSGRDEEVLF